MVLLFDPEQWRAAGRPGASFCAFSEPRNAEPGDLFGAELTAEEVGAAIGLTGRAVKDWAATSLALIESWRWERESPAGRLRHAQWFAAMARKLAGLDTLAALGRTLLRQTTLAALGDTLSGRTPPREPEPEPEQPVEEQRWQWIKVPSNASPNLSRLVLLRGSSGMLARDLSDQTVGFAIVRPSLGKGRGRGWLFRRARIGHRLGVESLPDWLRRG